MKEYYIKVEVDEDVVRKAAGIDETIDAVVNEAQWMCDSGITVTEVVPAEEVEEMKVPTSAGVLTAVKNPDPGQPGIVIMLTPAGCTDSMDMSFVSVYEAPDYVPKGENIRPVDVSIMTYSDPYTEDYTSKNIIRREDVMEALGEKNDD